MYPITELMPEASLVVLATWILMYGDSRLLDAVGIGE